MVTYSLVAAPCPRCKSDPRSGRWFNTPYRRPRHQLYLHSEAASVNTACVGLEALRIIEDHPFALQARASQRAAFGEFEMMFRTRGVYVALDDMVLCSVGLLPCGL